MPSPTILSSFFAEFREGKAPNKYETEMDQWIAYNSPTCEFRPAGESEGGKKAWGSDLLDNDII